MIFLDKLGQHPQFGRVLSKATEGATILRVHKDVWEIALKMAEMDKDKLLNSGPLLFAPDYDTWLDIDGGDGQFGFYFHGTGGKSITRGDTLLFMQKHTDEHPVLVPSHLDIPTGRLRLGFDPASRARIPFQPKELDIDPFMGNHLLSILAPVILAVLALVNSPKVVSKLWKSHTKLNKPREAKGKYLYHPHHAVRLNIDKHTRKEIMATGTGSPKALHLVRAHLRLVNDRYVLVSPHWRGDPQRGIMRTTYEADRQKSRWKD